MSEQTRAQATKRGMTFSSGRELHANRGIVGIAPDLTIYEGYDGGIAWPPDLDPDFPDEEAFTADDMRELADEMIARWTAFRGRLTT